MAAESPRLFNASVSSAQRSWGAKDAQELARSTRDQPAERAEAGWTTPAASTTWSQMQQQVTSVMESPITAASPERLQPRSQGDLGSGPVGGDVFAAAMKSMLDATNQAFGNMQNMAKQMTEIADANLQAATRRHGKAVGATK